MKGEGETPSVGSALRAMEAGAKRAKPNLPDQMLCALDAVADHLGATPEELVSLLNTRAEVRRRVRPPDDEDVTWGELAEVAVSEQVDLRSRLARAEAALRPFADATGAHDDGAVWSEPTRVRYDDFSRARAYFAEGEPAVLGHHADSNMLTDAIVAALSARGMLVGGWQGIETAPRDGTAILLARGGDDMDIELGYWSAAGYWADVEFEPTHWRPRPPPPPEEKTP